MDITIYRRSKNKFSYPLVAKTCFGSRKTNRNYKNKYPSLPSDKNLLLEVNDPREAELVLAGDSAVKLIYNDAGAKLNFGSNPKL